ncbi:MAG: helix-turn-helix transcriptional regulator [Pseudobutyrivibrio sp.]|nr:helix-turn-helix transcriptional regulator [Pseudobutyrivibrio sp.]
MKFSDVLQELREYNGMTQEDLAEELVVPRDVISRWEAGIDYPDMESLKTISIYFGITMDELLSCDELFDFAESDFKEKEQRINDIIFGVMDCSLIMYFFLPIFCVAGGGFVDEVSLFILTGLEPYVGVPFIVGTVLTVLVGVFSLVQTIGRFSTWTRCNRRISLILSMTLTILFLFWIQMYAASYTFIFLIIKVVILAHHQYEDNDCKRYNRHYIMSNAYVK